ncbi:MAG: hypothetical protein GF418_10685 [Chitinivibrionales bacterium]|nr:hypothetical protein [Chitinivibrionales bacterium]MBD3396080.1 hypothetical protein [Chitinivibrionales bacterium]
MFAGVGDGGQNINYICHMPRKARLHSPGLVHHVMARGIDGRAVFIDDADRNRFLDLLSRGLSRVSYKCYGWSLMPNHYHLVIRASEEPLGPFMRRLNSTYARYFNRKNERKGYVFQDRFKSIPTQDQLYLEELIRYVHLNPLRAGICRDFRVLNRYLWSGHSCIMGYAKRGFQDVKTMLRRFGRDNESARKAYLGFLKKGVEDDETDFVRLIRQCNRGVADSGQPACWVIGDRPFIQKAVARDRENRARFAEYIRQGLTISDIAAHVARALGVKTKYLRQKNTTGTASQARKILAHIGHRIYGIPVVKIGLFLGIGGPAVSMCLDEGERLFAKERIDLRFVSSR